MKLKGKKIQGPNVDYASFPRPDGAVVFKIVAILDLKPFNDLCPRPKPPKIRHRDLGLIENRDDANWLKEVGQLSTYRYWFTVVWSLKETEGLEWDRIKYSEPKTWELFPDELTEAGFTNNEITFLIAKILEVNGLDDSKLEAARNRFLQILADQSETSTSQTDEQSSTPSGEHVNGLASNPQQPAPSGTPTT